MMTINKLYTSTVLLTLSISMAHACITVFANDKGPTRVAARSMDLYVSDTPELVVYPRGIKRQGGMDKHALQWTSKYGSVVVTEFKTNTVSDGMNEAGLSAHLLYLTSTVYEKDGDTKPVLANALWAQYLLDNFKTVNDAVEGLQRYRVVSEVVFGREWPVHLAMEDQTGDAAVVEFIQGKMVVYHGPQYNIMTNEPAYAIQLKNLTRYRSFGGDLPLPGDTDPLSRFVRVSTYLKTLPQAKTTVSAIADVLSVMRTAAVPFGAQDTSGNKTEDAWSTRWISLADLTHQTYYFNSMTTPNIVWLNLKALNFSKGARVLSLDPNQEQLVGNVSTRLKPRARLK